MEINKEQFSVVKALATIGERSSEIAAILVDLNKSTNTYIESIGNTANKKVLDALKESHEALEEL